MYRDAVSIAVLRELAYFPSASEKEADRNVKHAREILPISTVFCSDAREVMPQ